MYIGSTGKSGLHHLLWEIVDNSVDEVLASSCDKIAVLVSPDGSVCVSDNGRGIPCGMHHTSQKSALETVLTVLHAGGKFGEGKGYTVSGGLHGVGLSVVNALSKFLRVEVKRQGKMYSMEFSRGKLVKALEIVPLSQQEDSRHGTAITFIPDYEDIFQKTQDAVQPLCFDTDLIAERCNEICYLHQGLTVTLTTRINEVCVFRHDGGLKSFLNSTMLKGSRSLVSESNNKIPDDDGILYFKTILQPATELDDNGIESIELACRWSLSQSEEKLAGYANGVRTRDGGTHLDGLKSALTKVVNTLLKKRALAGKQQVKKVPLSIAGEHIREGFSGILSIRLREPEFEGQTKTRLGNQQVRSAVDKYVSEFLTSTFEWNPRLFNAVVENALNSKAAAVAAKTTREMHLKQKGSQLISTVLPGKLADCSNRNSSETEIFIVEGDSAAGSAKQGRDRYSQAILPLRGKILNIARLAVEHRITQNQELQALITALGIGNRWSAAANINMNSPLLSLRYSRVIIMTDADVDGSHIRLLLLTFFYRYNRLLIENGRIFIACPPLYKVVQSRSKHGARYAYTAEELNKILVGTSSKGVAPTVQRFKGLGEMMAAELWDTTMNPLTRNLKRVTVQDADAAEKLVEVLMGDNVAQRKEFISTHAHELNFQHLDF